MPGGGAAYDGGYSFQNAYVDDQMPYVSGGFNANGDPAYNMGGQFVDSWSQPASWDTGATFGAGNIWEGAGGPSDWASNAIQGSADAGVGGMQGLVNQVVDNPWGAAWNTIGSTPFSRGVLSGASSLLDMYNRDVLDPLHHAISAVILAQDPNQDTFLNLDKAWKTAQYTSPGEALAIAPWNVFPGVGSPSNALSLLHDGDQPQMSDRKQHDTLFPEDKWTPLNLHSAGLDAAVQIFLDPMVIAGKVAGMSRARYLGRLDNAENVVPRVDASIDAARNGQFNGVLDPHHAEAEAVMGKGQRPLVDRIVHPGRNTNTENWQTQIDDVSPSVFDIRHEQTIDPTRQSLSDATGNPVDQLLTTTANNTMLTKPGLTDSGWAVEGRLLDAEGKLMISEDATTMGYRLSQDGHLVTTELAQTGQPVVHGDKAEPLIQLVSDPGKPHAVLSSIAGPSLLMDLPWLPKGYKLEAAQFLSRSKNEEDYLVRKGVLLGSEKAKTLFMEARPAEAVAHYAAEAERAKLADELSILRDSAGNKNWTFDLVDGFKINDRVTDAMKVALRRTPEEYDLAMRVASHVDNEYGKALEAFGKATKGNVFATPGTDARFLSTADKAMQKIVDTATRSTEASRAASAAQKAIGKGNITWFRPAGLGGAMLAYVSRATRELPDYMIGTKGAAQQDAPDAVKAVLRNFYSKGELNKVHYYGDGMKTTAANRQRFLFDEWTRRTQIGQSRDIAYENATRWLNEQLWHDMGNVHGLSEAQQKELRSMYDEVSQARIDAHRVTDDQQYLHTVHPDTGEALIIDDPQHLSQLRSVFPMIDFGEARRVMDSLQFKEFLGKKVTQAQRWEHRAERVQNLATSGGDAVMNVWKAAVLLRPLAYPTRNTFEGLTRWLASSGGVVNMARAITGERGSQRATEAAARAKKMADLYASDLDTVTKAHLENLQAVQTPFEQSGNLQKVLEAMREQTEELFRLRAIDDAHYHPFTDVQFSPEQFSAMHAGAMADATGVMPLTALKNVNQLADINMSRVAAYADGLADNKGFDQPLLLGLHPETGEVRLVQGQNRIAAAMGTGQTHVPVRVVVDRSGQGVLIRKVQGKSLAKSLDKPDVIQPAPGTPIFRNGVHVADGTPLDVSAAFTGQRWTAKNVKVWQARDAAKIAKAAAEDAKYTGLFAGQVDHRITVVEARLQHMEEAATTMLKELGIVDSQRNVIPGWENMHPVDFPDAESLSAIADMIRFRNELVNARNDWLSKANYFESLGNTKLRRGEGVYKFTDKDGNEVMVPGIYADQRSGEAVRNEVSGAGTMRAYTSSGTNSSPQSVEQEAYKSMAKIYKITKNTNIGMEEGPRFWDALADYANHHISGTPTMRMVLEDDPIRGSASFNDFWRYLGTRQGAATKEMFGLYTRADAKAQFDRWALDVNRAFPDPEIRSALARGEKVTAEMLKDAKPPVEGYRVIGTKAQELPVKDRLNVAGQLFTKVKNRMFNIIGTKPEDYFTRMPYANYRFQEHMADALQSAGHRVDTFELESMHRAATKAAIQDTRDTLYTTMRKRKVFESTRFVAAFAEAQYNSLGFWGRMLNENPQYIGRLAQIIQAPDKFGLVDQDGNIAVPIPGPFTNFFDGDTRVTLSKEALFNLYFNVGNQENPMLGGSLPGPTPLVGIAASEFAKTPWGDGVLKWADEQGGILQKASRFVMEQLVQQNPSTMIGSVDKLLPSYLTKSLHMVNTGSGGTDTWMASLQLQAWQSDHIKWMMNDGQGPQPMPDDPKYRDAAYNMAGWKVLTNLFSPLGFQMEDEHVKLGAKIYQKLQQQDPQHADRIMLQQYPQFVSLLAKPREAAKIGGSLATNEWIRTNEKTLRAVASIDPDAARMLVPYSQPNSFSMYAYRWQESNKIPGTETHWRQVVTPEEQRKEWEYKVANTLRYMKSDEINAEMARLGVIQGGNGMKGIMADNSYKVYKQQLTDYTDQLAKEFPGFSDRWNDGANIAKGLHILRAVTSDADFARENPVLANSIREYQTLRDEAVRLNEGQEWGWTTNKNDREQYAMAVDRIAAADPVFNRLYQSYLGYGDNMTMLSDGSVLQRKAS